MVTKVTKDTDYKDRYFIHYGHITHLMSSISFMKYDCFIKIIYL